MDYIKNSYKKLKVNYINFILIFFIWSSLFLSLNTNFVSIFLIFENFNYSKLISARSILIIISFVIIIFLTLKKGIKLKNNLFYILLLIILGIQSIYFFSNDFELIQKFSIKNIYEEELFSNRKYGVQLQSVQLFLSIFISLFLFLIFNNKKNEVAFVFTFIFFLTIFCVFYLYLFISSLPKHLNSPDVLLYFNAFFVHNSQLIEGEPAIRITGVGRSLVLISIILFCLYILIPKKNKYFKFLFLIVLILINTSILFTGSRFASYSFFITYCFLLFFLDFKFTQKIKFFSILIILPIISFLFFANILKHIQIDRQINELNNKLIKENTILNESKEMKELLKKKNQNSRLDIIKDTRYLEKINNTTGRIEIWKNAIEIMNKSGNYIIGNGINADRRLLIKYGNVYGTNASSGFINMILTAGILGVLFFILANLIILKNIFHFIFSEKCFYNFNKYYLINISILFIFVFYQRIFFENSFTSFGLDYLIYIVCSYFLLNKIKKIEILN